MTGERSMRRLIAEKEYRPCKVLDKMTDSEFEQYAYNYLWQTYIPETEEEKRELASDFYNFLVSRNYEPERTKRQVDKFVAELSEDRPIQWVQTTLQLAWLAVDENHNLARVVSLPASPVSSPYFWSVVDIDEKPIGCGRANSEEEAKQAAEGWMSSKSINWR